MLLLALGSGGCSDSSAEIGGATPDETARAYVDAINEHDGETVCGLMVPSAAYQFRAPDWGECPKFVSTLIGYGEESDTDTFHRARILELETGERKGELTSVELKIELELNEQGNDANRRLETFDDVLWLVQHEGRWRLAKASGVLYAAFAAYTVPDGLFEAPDLAAQEREYARGTAAERERREAEEASFRELEDDVLECAGAETAYDDPSHDLHIEGVRELTRQEAAEYGAADLRRIEVDTEDDDLCVRVTLRAAEIDRLLTIRFNIYSPKRNPSFLGPQMKLSLDVRSDGRARLIYADASAKDEYGRPQIVPLRGQIARDGDTFSFRVARRHLQEAVGGDDLPDWDGFLWGGVTFYSVTLEDQPRAISDDVPGQGTMISHPGEKIYEASARQTRDLPTG